MLEIETIINYTREGLLLVLWLSLPVVLGSAAAGMVVAVIQASTQLQDQATAAAMRLIVGALIVAVTAGGIGLSTKNFVDDMWRNAGYRAPPMTVR